MTLFKPEHFHLRAIKSILTVDSTFIKKIQLIISFDSFGHDIKYLSFKSHDISQLEFKNNLLYFEGCLCILEGEACLHIFQARHDFLVNAYFGYTKILELISRDIWWSQM